MGTSSDKMKLLITLQCKDVVVDRLRKQGSDIPAKIDEQKALLAGLRNEIEGQKKSVQQLQLQRKEKEIELGGKENEIRKHGTELSAIKTNEAYRALLTEIEKSKADKSVLEDGILLIMEQVEQESARIKDKEKEFKQKEGEVQARINELEGELRKDQEEIERLAAERGEFAKQLPSDLLSRYEEIRASRVIAVVPIKGGNCGGCHITLRPATINEVCKEQDFVLCDNCARILYQDESADVH